MTCSGFNEGYSLFQTAFPQAQAFRSAGVAGTWRDFIKKSARPFLYFEIQQFTVTKAD
jgi:hypothetical protein